MTIGLIDADGGQVLFDGQDVTRLPMYKRAQAGMGYLAQEQSVFKQLSVEDNLMAILETRPGMNRKARKLRQDELLSQLRPGPHPQDQGESGLRRRAEAARDRPVADHRAQADPPRRAVRRHRPQDRRPRSRTPSATSPRSTTSAILITDHQFRETLEVTDRTYVIREGRVFAYGDRESIINNADVRRYYIGERFDVGHLLDKRHRHETHRLGSQP